MRFAANSSSIIVLCALFGGACGTAHGETWATGPKLKEQLASRVTVSWSKTPLLRALKDLSAAQHVAIVLDRRVDPDQELTLALSREPLESGLKKIAQHLKLGYCQLGPVAYFGPPGTAERLRTLAALRLEEIKGLPPAVRQKFVQFRGWQWNDLAEPRKLAEDLAGEAGVELIGAEKIPHDLWSKADLPQLTWLERLTLLAAQFDLTFHVDKAGQRVELAPIPDKVTLARSYKAKQAASVAKKWAKALPTASVTNDDATVHVEGRLEDHEFVEQRLKGAPTQRTTVTPGKEVYQLAIENAALEPAVSQVAERLQLQLEWDRAAIDKQGISLAQLITVNVKDATLDDLLKALLAGTGLTFRRNEQAVSIFPAK